MRRHLLVATVRLLCLAKRRRSAANVALDRALAGQPGYSMALLLREALDSGAPPSLARLPMTPEEVGAAYDALEGPDTDDSTAGSAAIGDAPEG
jgi:hypothetical protein